MSKKQFWIRLAIYVLLAYALPGAFMIWRFQLFQTINKVQIGGWGIVFILFSAIFVIKLAKAVKKGLPFSYWTQVLNGVIKVTIPLIALATILYISKDHINEILQMLYVAIPFESSAYCVNPIPVWAHENKLDEQGWELKHVLKSAGLTKEDGSIKKD